VGDLTPTEPGQPDLRVGDAEREQVVDALRAHFAAGRLETMEYEDRTAAALRARTRSDLAPLLADLPAPARRGVAGPPVREPKAPDGPLGHYLRFWVPLSVFFILIWLLSGAGYFWPAWPMLGTGLPLLFMLSGHDRQR
jgi:hypothetical protein